jgi:hypothetical protein
VYLVGFENYKAGPDISHDSGFWLLVRTADAFPFVSAFRDSPAAFHEFRIEQKVGKEMRTSALNAQIVKIEESPTETRVLIGPDFPLP